MKCYNSPTASLKRARSLQMKSFVTPVGHVAKQHPSDFKRPSKDVHITRWNDKQREHVRWPCYKRNIRYYLNYCIIEHSSILSTIWIANLQSRFLCHFEDRLKIFHAPPVAGYNPFKLYSVATTWSVCKTSIHSLKTLKAPFQNAIPPSRGSNPCANTVSVRSAIMELDLSATKNRTSLTVLP